MIIIKGVNIFPMQIEKVLMALPEVHTNYLVELTRENFNDRMLVKVEVQEEFFKGRHALSQHPAQTPHRGPEKRTFGDPRGGAGGAQLPAPERRQGLKDCG
jgi:acyl-CoA synthetase (AMP-forming)/AMP-acid ligase II